ncbi:hypothetical protein CMsap09_06655 [Clavibacter michiganensis]|uniref:DUF3828 domain-containing protein n=1 Tax=Clavibacter michiganensis TaxID=28447 RepID=A0A251XT04_9MICO|nr:hypothetical protein CMsap09_06655 [Clavibacter michiganensis]
MHERPRHRPRRVTGTLTGSLALLLLSCVLSGCAAPEAPSPQGPPTPALSQEQWDAAAFKDLYTRYVDLPLDEETEDELRGLLTGRALESDLESLASDRASGRRIVGKETFRRFSVTDRGDDPQSGEYMVAQACLDVGGTRFVDAGGTDVTPQREALLSLQIKAVRVEGGDWRISDFVRNDEVRACA